MRPGQQRNQVGHVLLFYLCLLSLVLGFVLLYVYESNRQMDIKISAMQQAIQKAQAVSHRLLLAQRHLYGEAHLNELADHMGFIIPQGKQLVLLKRQHALGVKR